jgi:hypothetical protein
MNVRLVAGVSIIVLVFGGIFVACASDMGWLAAAATMAAGVGLAAVLAVGVILLAEGMDRR